MMRQKGALQFMISPSVFVGWLPTLLQFWLCGTWIITGAPCTIWIWVNGKTQQDVAKRFILFFTSDKVFEVYVLQGKTEWEQFWSIKIFINYKLAHFHISSFTFDFNQNISKYFVCLRSNQSFFLFRQGGGKWKLEDSYSQHFKITLSSTNSIFPLMYLE